MKKKWLLELERLHTNLYRGVGRKQTEQFLETLLEVIFPGYGSQENHSVTDLELIFGKLEHDLKELLSCSNPNDGKGNRDRIEVFFERLEETHTSLLLDSKAILDGDPAAESETEVIQSYPGFFAIASYRIAHLLDSIGVKSIPRIITEYAHSKTGIDIHPKSKIGSSFFIDHGTGIVIGETTIIGDRVKIYQGVTLGALSVSKQLAATKRHPTIENDVVIYAGATILGGETVVGEHSVIGGNTWITQSIPAYSTVFHTSTIVVKERKHGAIN